MSLEEVHFLLTYSCTYECEHCFLYSGPFSEGTFTPLTLTKALDSIASVPSVHTLYFEGGEPFLFHPLLLNALDQAHQRGFKLGVVTNAFWATSEENAALYLIPLTKFDIIDLSISNDAFHSGKDSQLVQNATKVASELGFPLSSISVEELELRDEQVGKLGAKCSVMFRGRAADQLTADQPSFPAATFTECPYENLTSPKRVHVDPFGNVHLCQGISIGNMLETPLATVMEDYSPENHPILGPIVSGGPLELAKSLGFSQLEGYVDSCHFCYTLRKNALERYPRFLTPPQVYGKGQT